MKIEQVLCFYCISEISNAQTERGVRLSCQLTKHSHHSFKRSPHVNLFLLLCLKFRVDGIILKCESSYQFNWLFSFSNLTEAHSDASRVKSFMMGKSKGAGARGSCLCVCNQEVKGNWPHGIFTLPQFFFFFLNVFLLFYVKASGNLHPDLALDTEVLGKPLLPLVIFLHSLYACAQVSGLSLRVDNYNCGTCSFQYCLALFLAQFICFTLLSCYHFLNDLKSKL